MNLKSPEGSPISRQEDSPAFTEKCEDARETLLHYAGSCVAGDFFDLVSNSPQETFNIGERIAAFLSSGSVVALIGELGSGKTYLAKGIARGLGITENITSPTYTIISEYQTDDDSTARETSLQNARETSSYNTLFHIDAYRLNNDKDFEDLGGLEIINSDGICIIEWSERIPKSLPESKITISLEITGSCSRLIRIKGLVDLQQSFQHNKKKAHSENP